MTKRRIWDKPLTCEDCQTLLPSFIAKELSAELMGRMRGHLSICDVCDEALADALGNALDSGEIPLTEVPETIPPFPARKVFYALRSAQFIGPVWESVKDQVETWAEDLRRMLAAAIFLWRTGWSTPKPRGILRVDEIGKAEATQEKHVHHVDASWQPLDEYETFRVVSPPVVTGDGKFTLTLSTIERKWSGRSLICKMDLVEGGSIAFESTVQPIPDRKEWQVKIEADGLPAPDRDVPVPLERLHLYLAPIEEG